MLNIESDEILLSKLSVRDETTETKMSFDFIAFSENMCR